MHKCRIAISSHHDQHTFNMQCSFEAIAILHNTQCIDTTVIQVIKLCLLADGYGLSLLDYKRPLSRLYIKFIFNVWIGLIALANYDSHLTIS